MVFSYNVSFFVNIWIDKQDLAFSGGKEEGPYCYNRFIFFAIVDAIPFLSLMLLFCDENTYEKNHCF